MPLDKTRNAILFNRYILAIATALLIVSTLELFDVVELPLENLFGGSLTGSFFSFMINFMSKNAYPALFVLMFLESASLPIPSEFYLPFAGYLIYSKVMSFPIALSVATVSGVLGALVDFYIGLALGRVFVGRVAKYFMIPEESIERAERWISTKGSVSVLIARFIPGLRSIISFPAGILNMDKKMFLITTTLGTLGWSAILMYAGYVSGKLWQFAINQIETTSNEIIIVFVACISAFYIVYYALGKVRKSL